MTDGLTGKTGMALKKIPLWAWLLAVFLLGFLLRGGGDGQNQGHGVAHTAAENSAPAEVWTCAMHPQVRQPGPGKCPICAMDLIPVPGGDDDSDLGPRQIRLSASARELAGIATAPVVPGRPAQSIRMPGRVAYDETTVANVTAWAGGRIDRLYVDYTGMAVRRGQPLAQLYSPELYSAQEELLQALRASEQFKSSGLASVRQTAENTVAATRRKLELLGMSEAQIARLIERGEPSTHLDIFSPINGTVVKKEAVAGMYVMTGAKLYEVSDLSKVWVELAAYEQDLPWLAVGQDVSFSTPSAPGRTFSGKIEFIDPVLDPASRTAAVRVAAANRDSRLKPGMLATAVVDSRIAAGSEDSALMIPATAPLVTGKRAVVYVAIPNEPGVFEGREITLGPRSGNYYIVREGLAEGESVVVNGAFKIDAALQIAAKPSMMNPEAGMHDHSTTTGDGSESHEGHAAAAMAMDKKKIAAQLPERFTAGLATLYTAYFPVHDALASDDYEGAVRAADKFATALAAVDMSVLDIASHEQWMTFQRDLSKARENISAAGDMAGARDGFDRLSAALITVVKSFGGHGVDSLLLFHCPMAFDNRGAQWLQNHSAPRNPYYGAMMLQCQDRVDILYPPAGKEARVR